LGDAIDEKLLFKLTEFIQKYLPYTDRDLIQKYLKEHSIYGTIDYALDDNQEVIGLVRWNVSENGEIGIICDLAIRPDWRNKGLGNHFIRNALKKYPQGKWLVFKRGRKTRNEERKILISEFLKHSNF
jgi:ribosomal protein S18 acetylase RimI-like enzyme